MRMKKKFKLKMIRTGKIKLIHRTLLQTKILVKLKATHILLVEATYQINLEFPQWSTLARIRRLLKIR